MLGDLWLTLSSPFWQHPHGKAQRRAFSCLIFSSDCNDRRANVTSCALGVPLKVSELASKLSQAGCPEAEYY